MSTSPFDGSKFSHYSTFEPEAQKELFHEIRKSRLTCNNDSIKPIPIFIITCDRLTALIRAMLSYYKVISAPITIVIHDNETTFPPTRMFLERLVTEGIPVFWNQAITNKPCSLGAVKKTVEKWFEKNDADYYVVTDPDIEIEAGAEKILSALTFLLQQYEHIDAVGPMLRKDDLPAHYPLRDFVHKQQDDLYRPEKQWIKKWGDQALFVQAGWIDTAFALYRKTFKFRNLNRSLQTHEPYIARHSDWYIDPSNLTEDQLFYKQKNNPVGHWSSSWLPDELVACKHFGKDMTLPSSYKIVRKQPLQYRP